MKISTFFQNVGWESGCVYNIEGKGNSKCEGGANIEHHFTVDGQPNVWIQKRKEKIFQAIINDYAEDTKDGYM